jgi:hypothetical protein
MMRDFGAPQFLVALFIVITIAVVAPITLRPQMKTSSSSTVQDHGAQDPLSVDDRVRVLHELEKESAQSGVPIPSVEERLRALEALEKEVPVSGQSGASTSIEVPSKRAGGL